MKYEFKFYNRTYLLTAEQVNKALIILHSLVLLKKEVSMR